MKSHDQIELLKWVASVHHSWQWSLANTKRTTGFTCEYLSLVSYYSRVEKVHDRNYLRAFLTRQLSLVSSILSCRTSPTHELNANSSRHESLLTFFVNLDVSCTVVLNSSVLWSVVSKQLYLQWVWKAEFILHPCQGTYYPAAHNQQTTNAILISY